MTKDFASKLFSHGSIEQDYLSKNMKSFSFWGVYRNIGTESAENSTIYDLLFLFAIFSPKNDNKHLPEIRN